MMMILQKGQPLDNEIRKHQEGPQFEITDDGLILFIYFSKPTEAEIQSISNDRLTVGYFVKDDIIFMLFKFLNMSWIDAPYSVHLSKNLKTFFDVIENDDEGLALTLILADADTGIVEALRVVGLGPNFSRNLQREIIKQSKTKFIEADYDSKLQQIYSKYTTEAMAYQSINFCGI